MPSSSEIVSRSLRKCLHVGALALIVAACDGGSTAVPLLPLSAVARIDVLVGGDSVLLGDTLQAVARGVNRVGDVLTLGTTVWSTSDSGVISVATGGMMRARNVGTIRLDVSAAGVGGSRPIRVVARPYRITITAPDTVELVDQIRLSSQVVTTAGELLAEVAPRFASTDTSIARVQALSIGVASVEALKPGVTELLAVIGRDTTRRQLVVRVTPLRSLSVAIVDRVLAIGDSVPFIVSAIDTLGRTVPSGEVVLGVEPFGRMRIRSGHLIALTVGRAVVSVTNGTLVARDTLTAQAPSEFPLDIVDGDGQNPLPLRVRLSMDRVAAKWQRVLRTASAGEFVRLAVGECRNAVSVGAFITGLRVLVKLDTLAARIAGQGGPCVIRANGLPLLGTVSLNILNYNTLSDRKLDDLIQHEVGHVLGLGTIWGRGVMTTLVNGGSDALDPIFVGANALAAFPRLGQSRRFTGRTVPLQLNSRGHWRGDAFAGEIMAPSLTAQPQRTSAVTVAALRDLGWDAELEAHDDFALPESVLSAPSVSARVVGPRLEPIGGSIEGDVLFPEIVVISGRKVRLDPVSGVPQRR